MSRYRRIVMAPRAVIATGNVPALPGSPLDDAESGIQDIVGSDLERDGGTWNPVERERVRRCPDPARSA
jgi:hypothetical protein